MLFKKQIKYSAETKKHGRSLLCYFKNCSQTLDATNESFINIS